MRLARGFYLLDLTIGIFMILAVGSVFAHVLFEANRAATHLTIIRSEARAEQSTLLALPNGHALTHSHRWIIHTTGTGSPMPPGVPSGFHWLTIRPAKGVNGPRLYGLVSSGQGGAR